MWYYSLFSLVLASDLSDHFPHFLFLRLPGCQEKEFSKHFPTPAVWYCCEVNTGSLAATLHWLQCCICSSAESKLLIHLSSYLSFTGAKAGISPSTCPQSCVNFQFFLWNGQGEESQESSGSQVILALRLKAQQMYCSGKVEIQIKTAGIICPSVSSNVVLYSLTASSHVIKHNLNGRLEKMDFILHKEPISYTSG